jgi:excisionase family DNA binding protein
MYRRINVTPEHRVGLDDRRRSAMTSAKDATDDGRDELWDANGVARYLKVSRSWVYQKTEAGTLPCLRVGGLVRFDPATVRAFARGEVQPPKVLAFPTSPSGKNG